MDRISSRWRTKEFTPMKSTGFAYIHPYVIHFLKPTKGAMSFMHDKQEFQVSCKLDKLASRFHSTSGITMMKICTLLQTCFLGCSSLTISAFSMCYGLFSSSDDTLLFHVVPY